MCTFYVSKSTLGKVGANFTASDYQELIENQRSTGKKDLLEILLPAFLIKRLSLFSEAMAHLILQRQN